MENKKNLYQGRAFTLIELLVVLLIIGILTAVGVVAYNGFINASKVIVTKNNHNELIKFLKLQLSICELDGKIKLMSDANSLVVNQISCSTTGINNLTVYIVNHFQNLGYKNAFNNQESAITGIGRPQSKGQTYLGIDGNPSQSEITGRWWISTKISDDDKDTIWGFQTRN